MRPRLPPVPGLIEELPKLVESLEQDLSSRNVVRVAEALWRLGRPERAIELLEPLTSRDRGSIAPRVLLGWCYEDAGRGTDAGEAFALVHDLDPANPYARPRRPQGIARELEPPPDRAGEREAEPEEALTEEELREIPPGPLYSMTLGRIFEKQGFEEKAKEIYAEIQRRDPEARGGTETRGVRP
jgi:tetratricopeptide (TPR) repeat protein